MLHDLISLGVLPASEWATALHPLTVWSAAVMILFVKTWLVKTQIDCLHDRRWMLSRGIDQSSPVGHGMLRMFPPVTITGSRACLPFGHHRELSMSYPWPPQGVEHAFLLAIAGNWACLPFGHHRELSMSSSWPSQGIEHVFFLANTGNWACLLFGQHRELSMSSPWPPQGIEHVFQVSRGRDLELSMSSSAAFTWNWTRLSPWPLQGIEHVSPTHPIHPAH